MSKTKVIRAHKDTPSLRTTIPQDFIAYLDVKDGDSVEWDFLNTKQGKVVVVRKV